jgi:prevent-host-death family protein
VKRVGVYEAKTQLSSLVKAVSHGERVIITHRGEPVAELVPPHESGRNAVERLLANQTPLGVPLRQAIQEGRL